MYLINIYGSANKTDLKRIFISQKRAIKIAHDVHYRFNSVELFTQQATKTLPLLLLYEKSISTLTHQIYHDHIHHTTTLNVLSHSNQIRAAFQRKLVVRQSELEFMEIEFLFIKGQDYITVYQNTYATQLLYKNSNMRLHNTWNMKLTYNVL